MNNKRICFDDIFTESISINPQLKYADLTVITNENCRHFYAGIIDSTKLCTDTLSGTIGACIVSMVQLYRSCDVITYTFSEIQGDFGGPLVFYESDMEPTQIGIASFVSSAGCESGTPDAYTRVSAYLDWLVFNANITIRP
jgi:hypothetical protein